MRAICIACAAGAALAGETRSCVRRGEWRVASAEALAAIAYRWRVMGNTRKPLPWSVPVALVAIGAAEWLRGQTTGVPAALLYGVAVASVVVGIVSIFAWARAKERLEAERPTRYWFTPWRDRSS